MQDHDVLSLHIFVYTFLGTISVYFSNILQWTIGPSQDLYVHIKTKARPLKKEEKRWKSNSISKFM